MRLKRSAFCGGLLTLAGCAGNPAQSDVATAESFLDAFYSWEPDRLAAIVVPGEDADRALYYQAWARAGNYQVQTRRPCERSEDGRMHCAVTVTDDIGAALGYVATDTFHLTIDRHVVQAVSFTADDPPVLAEVFQWLGEEHPEVFTGPCKDMFSGGTTPELCVRAVIDGAHRYLQRMDAEQTE